MSEREIINRIGIIFLSYRRQLQGRLSGYNITLQQYRILKILAAREYLYPSEIAGMLYCDRPTATLIIRNLEKKNWIKKERDKDNGKLVRITITAHGINKFKEARKAADDIFDVEKTFSAREQKKLNTLLLKLQDGIAGIDYERH